MRTFCTTCAVKILCEFFLQCYRLGTSNPKRSFNLPDNSTAILNYYDICKTINGALRKFYPPGDHPT